MIALFLIPIIYAIPVFIFAWFIKWLAICHPSMNRKPLFITIGIIFFLLTTNMYISFLFRNNALGRNLKRVSNYWLAVLIYALMAVLITLLIRVIVIKVRKHKGKGDVPHALRVIFGVACLVVLAGVLTYGFINARIVRTTKYDVKIEKDGGKLDDLNVVLLADLHLGYNIGKSNMRDMVNAVNKLDPDLIIVAGDIFDNSFEAVDDPEGLISILTTMKSKYGVYCVYGNHDIEEKLLMGFSFNYKAHKESGPQMDEFIEKCGWKFLADEGVMLEDSIYMFGRPDYKNPGKNVTERLTPSQLTEGISRDIPIIMFEHQPVELKELSAAGVDLEMAGHTHDGQFFPMNITNKFSHENGYGYKNVNGMHSIVTSGVGLYGPYIRVGTIAEVVQIKIHFN